MEEVKLRNGTSEADVLVAATMLSLRALAESKPVALIELVEVCRDPKHTIWGQCAEELKDVSLLQPDGRPHDSIRNIVQSAAEGEGFEVHLVDPKATT